MLKLTLKTIILFIFLINGNAILAQKCKFETNEKDPFSGSKKLLVKEFVHSKENRLVYTSLKYTEGKFTFGILFPVKGIQERTIKANSNISLKLDNGKILILNSITECLPVHFLTSGRTKYEPFYSLTDKELKELIESRITHIKVSLESSEEIFEIDEKRGGKFQKKAICINNESRE